jgi:hypothetical protein
MIESLASTMEENAANISEEQASVEPDISASPPPVPTEMTLDPQADAKTSVELEPPTLPNFTAATTAHTSSTSQSTSIHTQRQIFTAH